MASFDVLIVQFRCRPAAASTYFNVWTQAGDVNFLYVLAAYSVPVQRVTNLPIENTIKWGKSDVLGCHTPVTSGMVALTRQNG